MRFPFLAKLTTVGAVALLVLVPLIATRGKIEERQRLNNDARRSIVESSAGEQRLIAPVLRVGCIETYTEVRTISERGRDQTVRQTKERECEQINFAPEVFEVSGRVDLEQTPRYRKRPSKCPTRYGVLAARSWCCRWPMHVASKTRRS
jgi:inner membrane protein involved in colicin E2 resistance